MMLFGHGRVSERVHLMATFFVALGTTLSAFWILALNSWMQTPAGLRDHQRRVPRDRAGCEVIFNPSFPYRFTHMLLASALTCAFLMAGLSGLAAAASGGGQSCRHRACCAWRLTLAALLIPLQIFVGDLHGLNTLEHQPQKVAAMEGVWETQRGAPLLLFALPDDEQRTNHFEIGIPKLASWILTHSADGEIKGLNEFRA